MKILLSCLMCLVLTLSQAFAISGGPFITVTGTYAGVFTPIPVVVDPGPPPVTLPPDNSLGLFSVAIAPEGLHTGSNPTNAAVGAVVIFRNGIVYTGWPNSPPTTNPPGTFAPGIIGTADPSSGKLKAIVSTSASIAGTGTATGTFDTTKIQRDPNHVSSASLRIRGKANITYISSDPTGDSGGAIPYKVRGFKQSDTASTASATSG